MDEQQVLKQRLRAERRKKILSNAKSRMEKLRNVQQWWARKQRNEVVLFQMMRTNCSQVRASGTGSGM